MSLEDLAGHTYGPFPYRADPEKVEEYRAVVGGRPGVVPRSLAGALLFQVAPSLLTDERAGAATNSVIHGDQSFTWHGDVAMGAELAVTGTVTRVRGRGGVFFTSFEMEVSHRGATVIDGSSTFLLSAESTTGAEIVDDRPEPPPLAGSASVVDGVLGEDEAELGAFGASRADLVRYAGASRDWNPIHWDHAAAVAAGLPGVVVHGLFQSGWMIEAAGALGHTPETARFRYRRPLLAGVPATLTGRISDGGATLTLGDADGAYTTGTFG